MPNVELTDQEWQQVLGCIGNAPWTVANPLLMKIGDQLRAAAARKFPLPDDDTHGQGIDSLKNIIGKRGS